MIFYHLAIAESVFPVCQVVYLSVMPYYGLVRLGVHCLDEISGYIAEQSVKMDGT